MMMIPAALCQRIAVKPTRVRLFIRPRCGWCDKAVKWLDDHGVDFEILDVTADDQAADEMVRLSGQDMSPVLDVDGEILADFGTDQLAQFWQRLAKAHADA